MTGHEHRSIAEPSGADETEWRKVAARVRNWGRWGSDDELGTLNHITPEAVKYAASLARTGRVIPLGVPLNAQGPQGARTIRGNPLHIMTVDGGDAGVNKLPKGWGSPFMLVATALPFTGAVGTPVNPIAIK